MKKYLLLVISAFFLFLGLYPLHGFSQNSNENGTIKESKITDYLLYIGTYTTGGSEGIYRYKMDSNTGSLTTMGKATKSTSPSFLAVDPQNKFLYAVNEVSKFNGKSGGSVSAFSIDPSNGDLTLLNQQASKGESPCYVSVDNESKWILLSNYSGGTVSVLPILDGGKLGPASDTIKHSGSSVNQSRQEGPHPHSIFLDAANKFAFVPDLGLDKVMIYQFDRTNGKLKPNEVPFVATAPGAGPRHFAFHPNGKLGFLIHEINSTITSYAYAESNGALTPIQTVSALPEGYSGTSYCADIHVSPSGKFVYGSNRGHDSIVIYAVDENTGKMTYIEHESTKGKTPRNFAIDPTGSFLFVANQDSKSIVSFRIDPKSGKLQYTGQTTEVPSPVCIKFVPITKSNTNITN